MNQVPHSSKNLAELSESSVFEAPVVCRAGYFQFSVNQAFTNNSVQSRALFWCKSGHGQFAVNGVVYPLEPHDLYILPWNRKISYFPDQRDPMYTGHIHIVPYYKPNSKWVANVPHEVNEVAFDSPDRSDVQWPDFDETLRLKIQANEPLGLLMDYTIRWYLHSHGSEETEARKLGYLVVRELFRLRTLKYASSNNYPEELRRMIAHIDKGFYLAPTVNDLAKILGRSRSHVLKMFSKHMGVSPKNYIINRQLQEARELLLSTTTSIAEVGQLIGISDPYHFSKLFKRHVGIPPSQYRQDHGPFSTPPNASSHLPAPVKSSKLS
jgi:AraC-like DNA-binding protein